MKIKTLIKAAFFMNPEKFGYVNSPLYSVVTIWDNLIKPHLKDVDNCKKISNAAIPEYLPGYIETLRDYVEEFYADL